MKDLLKQLAGDLRQGRPVAYCRLVETRGSTPQKAGALMLVYPDGSQAGTLGGGCVEAEVKRQALVVLEKRGREVASFQLDHDYGWDDGLICGGRMQILIDAVTTDGDPDTLAYYTQLAELISSGAGTTEAIVFDAEAADFETSASMLFDAQGAALSRLRCDEARIARVAAQLRGLDSRPRAYAERGVAFLPVLPRCRLIIVGGGHVGLAVADMATQLDFDVWVVDDREEYVSQERFPAVERRICGEIESVLPDLPIDRSTYCLIITRGHQHDERALFHLAERDARYVGLIGSRRKIKMIFDDLLDEGISRDALEKVYAPLGINIGSQTVPEIAVSICGELVAHRNCDGRVPGRPQPVTV